MKQLRRIDQPPPADTFHKTQRGLLRHVAFTEAEFRALERERPDLIVMEGEAVLIAHPRQQRIELNYAFPDRDAFVRGFPSLFGPLAAAVREEDGPLGYRFRLVERSSRPYVEPVLFAQAFEWTREWFEMELVELPDDASPGSEIAPGFVLREVRAEDAAAIVGLEELAFPNPGLTVEALHEALRTPALRWVLEQRATGDLAGSLFAERLGRATGHISTLSVHPDFQRRGLGEAMMRWVLAWFQQQGMRRAALTVNTDNAPAIALYRKLGFTPGEAGIDYRRPVAEEEVQRVLEKRRGSLIKFGGWR